MKVDSLLSVALNNTSQKAKREFVNRNKFDDENRRTVIYTRVSSKRQADNTSLESQKIECLRVAEEYNYEIVAEFGGTYESAKSFKRKEMEKVLNFIKEKKNKIAFILFYDFDRFARDIEAIQLSQELKDKYKIRIVSSKSPTAPTNEFDFISQNQQHLNNYLENVKRTDKIVKGTTKRLREGYWTTKPPVGYKRIYEGKNSRVVPDENAKYIKKIFQLRVERRLDVPQIYKIVSDMGFKMQQHYYYRILENIFYCGYIVHGLLNNGEIVKGRHEAIISENIWLEINTPDTKAVEKSAKDNYDELSLKGYMKCDCCNKNLTGYYIAKKDKYYYKCNTKGCKLNISSRIISNKFRELLDRVCISEDVKQKVRKTLLESVEVERKELESNKATFYKKLNDLEEKLKAAKIRFAIGEIESDIYEAAKTQISLEINVLRQEIANVELDLSNFSEDLDRGLEMLDGLGDLWQNSDIDGRKRVQNAVINSSLVYDRKKGRYRTDGLNCFLRFNIDKSRGSEMGKNENSQLLTGNSSSVVPTRIELVSKV